MKEVLSAKSIDNIYKEIIEEKNYIIHAEVEGLIVGLYEFFERLATQKKELLKAKKRFKLDKLIFDSDISGDVKLFFEYVGYFNEGSMKMIVYSQEKKYMIIDIIDGDEILLERCSSSD